MTFYQSVLGGELQMIAVSDTPMSGQMPPEAQGLLMHSQLSGDGWVFMATDMSESAQDPGSIQVGWESQEELQAAFDKLSDGATIICPVGPAFWGGIFGALTDRYGTVWMFSFEG